MLALTNWAILTGPIFQGQQEGSPNGGEEAELIWETFPYAAFSKVRPEHDQRPFLLDFVLLKRINIKWIQMGLSHKKDYQWSSASIDKQIWLLSFV